MKKLLFLLFAYTMAISGCSLLQEDSTFNLTEQEVTSILNDACTIKRDSRQRYKIDGKRYRTLSSSRGYKKRGTASWYGSDFDGKQTACGEEYDKPLAVKSMICMISPLLIRHFHCPLT